MLAQSKELVECGKRKKKDSDMVDDMYEVEAIKALATDGAQRTIQAQPFSDEWPRCQERAVKRS